MNDVRFDPFESTRIVGNDIANAIAHEPLFTVLPWTKTLLARGEGEQRQEVEVPLLIIHWDSGYCQVTAADLRGHAVDISIFLGPAEKELALELEVLIGAPLLAIWELGSVDISALEADEGLRRLFRAVNNQTFGAWSASLFNVRSRLNALQRARLKALFG